MIMSEVRDLLLWSPRDLQGMQEALSEDWRDWSSNWLGTRQLDGPLVRSMNECASDLANMTWVLCDVGGGSSAGFWRGHTRAALNRLACHMVTCGLGTEPSPDDWALSAAHAAIHELERRWGQRLVLPGVDHASCSLTDTLSPLKGGVIITCPSLGLQWLLPVSAAQTLLKEKRGFNARQTLQPIELSQLLPTQRVSVELGLHHVDISVADLTGLRVGDVVRFPSLLKDPLPVGVPGTAGPEAQLQAQLGQHEGRVAIKVVGKARPAQEDGLKP